MLSVLLGPWIATHRLFSLSIASDGAAYVLPGPAICPGPAHSAVAASCHAMLSVLLGPWIATHRLFSLSIASDGAAYVLPGPAICPGPAHSAVAASCQ